MHNPLSHDTTLNILIPWDGQVPGEVEGPLAEVPGGWHIDHPRTV
jgi:hypothetical protein